MLASGVAAGAHAQNRPERDDRTVLPIWNNASGQLEALLVLEPTDDQTAKSGAQLRFGGNRLDAAFGLKAGDSLALLCDHQSGLSHALGNLANNCLLASLDDDIGGDDGGRRNTATAALSRPGGSVGVSVGETSGNLPTWLTSSGTRSGGPGQQVDGNDLTVFVQKNIRDQGYVSIAGTVAKARLIPYTQAPDGLADRWDSKSLSVGGGFGDFGANIVGQVIDTPGQPRWEGLGLGLTWRTPWSGQLTVGAENVVTRGRNPFSPRGENGEDEGTVPYVRYEQDL
ncbi:hypothetical protein [Luteimonas sp. R10]|uniref:XOO1806 family protein n=1 Tax=Luteimonas sp. R10 TaxID=3108176 RepID=UPI00308E1469|nr:hypothetical protein U3649_16930 [Luteimonas sp. R10]